MLEVLLLYMAALSILFCYHRLRLLLIFIFQQPTWRALEFGSASNLSLLSLTHFFFALSSRMPQLVSIILEAGTASNLIEDYAACLETRAEESQAPENPDEDIGSLILRVCLRISIFPQKFISLSSHLGMG